jgi:hypothetical protein
LFELGALAGSLFVRAHSGARRREPNNTPARHPKNARYDDEAKTPLRAAGAAASDRPDAGSADVERGERRRARWTRETTRG